MIEINIKISGIILMLLALVHVIFPKYFNWEEDLKPLSLINRQMMIIHTFFIALAVFLMGLCSFLYALELVATPFGKIISLGFAIFWLFRLVIQFVGYSSQLWKGKRFETIVHVVFSVFWCYLVGLHFYNYYI